MKYSPNEVTEGNLGQYLEERGFTEFNKINKNVSLRSLMRSTEIDLRSGLTKANVNAFEFGMFFDAIRAIPGSRMSQQSLGMFCCLVFTCTTLRKFGLIWYWV